MTIPFNKALLPAACLLLSILVHVLFFYAWLISGTYDFTRPVSHEVMVEVDLTQQAPPSPEEDGNRDEAREAGQDAAPEAAPAPESPPPATPKTTVPATEEAEKLLPPPDRTAADTATPPDKPRQQSGTVPRLTSEKFLSSPYEKLTYLISLFGIPVGTAELEAKNANSEVLITLRVTSNAAISSIYPVNNLIETRHIDGKFILTKIRQQEGSFKSDEWFSINLLKKRVSWFDNLGGRSQIFTVPTRDVFDTLSGIYLLRNRHLQVGKTETLHIFDSESYADVPVEILRRESVRLTNLTTVDTLVVQPLQKSAGIFRRTGDIIIWMTDDAFKVPVKIVTSVKLGTVTVELISAESKTPVEK